MLYPTVDHLDFRLADLPAVPPRKRVLLTTPAHFDVQYVINPHMADHVGTVDTDAAARQWQALRDAYAEVGITPTTINGADGLPDMVFCANQTLPYYDPRTDETGVVLSRMHAPERQAEVPHYRQFFDDQDYRIRTLPDAAGDFEGMGDAIWHPDRFLLWGGYGFRTGLSAYRHLADLLDVRILPLALDDPDFYHLDTCFSVLDAQSVLIYPEVFDADGRALIEHFFPTVVEAPENEARELFACNAHCPDGSHVFIQDGCTTTIRRLEDAGFTPVALDTSEFLKAGGSVFCMKQMIW